MASLQDIRKRIKSVKNSEKITKAMKMVAAAKLKKAQDEVRKSKNYADRMNEVVGRVSKRLSNLGELPHALLQTRAEKKKVELLVLTSDRGLCGAFNANVIRKAQQFLKENPETRLSTIGRKGFDAFRREGREIRKDYEGILLHPSHHRATEIAVELAKSYVEDQIDAVYLVYHEFRSAISQIVVFKPLLPLTPVEVSGDLVDYVYEPSQTELLNNLLPRHLAMQIYQAFLESAASEHGARMTAMENATRNAKEVISALTLQYNRARQAAITKELMEIIGGAEALA